MAYTHEAHLAYYIKLLNIVAFTSIRENPTRSSLARSLTQSHFDTPASHQHFVSPSNNLLPSNHSQYMYIQTVEISKKSKKPILSCCRTPVALCPLLWPGLALTSIFLSFPGTEVCTLFPGTEVCNLCHLLTCVIV